VLRRIRHGAALPALLLPALCACRESASPRPTPVWADEFEGPAGRPPDPAKWTYDVGTDWGNEQLEYDTDRPGNAALDGDGHLAITAREEPFRGSAYTSARITTEERFEPTYGRIEARIRLPTGRGLWPAFWLLGANVDSVGWPASGEIDVMEYRGQRPDVVLGTLHGPGYSASQGLTRDYVLDGDRFDRGFHVFALEWVRDSIRWLVDDVPYHAVERGEVPGDWVFDHPFYIILNVAVGGGFVGAPDSATVFPQSMLIDWVRVHQRAR